MTRTNLTVNGQTVSAEIDDRTHLADFLRDDLLLTGTHLGCEHGVCGACTVLIDDEPARACIAYASLCDGADIRTVEGLADDPVIVRLRDAFSAEHALQCGYCTPGMLVTARDIIRRLPNADDDCIRLELAGNLCRCTGYNGIVRAIRRVLDERLTLMPRAVTPVPANQFEMMAASTPTPTASEPANIDGLHQRLRFDVPAERLWAALQDPALIARSIPGATLRAVEGSTITGDMLVAFGPVRVRFAGQATLTYDQTSRSGTVRGGGNDRLSGTRVSAEAAFRVTPESASSSVLAVDVDYDLRGPLAQLAKGRVAELMAGEIASLFGANLAADLRGDAAPARPRLSAIALMLAIVRRWFGGIIGRT
jgi:carbon-monoxide dehydrogenase small subunit